MSMPLEAVNPHRMNIEACAERMLNYLRTHPQWMLMTKDDAVRSAVVVLCTDIGAMQDLLDAVGLNVDLYE
jgi:hypothetical protein